MTEQTILFNYKKAIQQANDLIGIANRMSKIGGNELNDTMQTVSANWKGRNASTYLGKGAKLQSDITSTAKDLIAVANEIKSIAKRIRDTELKNLRIAEARTYGGGGSGSFGGGSGGGGGIR